MTFIVKSLCISYICCTFAAAKMNTMKKELFVSTILIVLCLLSAVHISANVITGVAAIPEGYYDAVDGKKNADNILSTLCSIIDDHHVISYSGLEPYYEQTDFYADTLWDMYSTCRFTMGDANVPQKAVCDGWNKEHVCCQSWLGSGPMVSDLFNVYPTDARINNLRSNFPYGVVSSFSGFSKDPNHHGLGKLGPSTTEGIGTCYEPDDRYKGDFARTFFYMVARYRDNSLNAGNGSKMFKSSPTDFTAYSLSFLLEWHRNDPVSQKEIDRNQAVYGIQNNRNPFIDYPELVEYIWGNKVGQTIDLASMVPTCDGGGYDPGSVTKYGVTWSVCGTVIGVDSVVAGRVISSMPETPVSCSTTSDVFMGWTTAPIEGTSDQAPVLYRKAAEVPVITADITLYAVFAHAEEGAVVEPATYIYDEEHQEGWTNTATKGMRAYWLLDQGQVLISPEVDLAGLATIVVKMRTYGGSNYCNLDVKAGETQIATIVAIEGSKLTEYTWTNEQHLSGKSALTFSTNYDQGKGIGITSVTINATGAGMTYSEYLTSGETSGIENQKTDINAQKFIQEGQLFIRVGERIYTVTGVEVK